MDVVHTHCAGLDVHKLTVVACRFSRDAQGHRVQVTETFGTTTAELLHLSDWLTLGECTHVAMESTGEYWKPIWNILEGSFELLLVNAQHVKRVSRGVRRTCPMPNGWRICCSMVCSRRASFRPSSSGIAAT